MANGLESQKVMMTVFQRAYQKEIAMVFQRAYQKEFATVG